MLVRNVGHHMMTDAVLDADGAQIPETLLDAAVTALIALHDLRRDGPAQQHQRLRLYRQAENAWAGRSRARRSFFATVEDFLGLPRLHAQDGHHGRGAAHDRQSQGGDQGGAADRVVFINTGFLDRTGDEIHTSMEAGPMIRKRI